MRYLFSTIVLYLVTGVFVAKAQLKVGLQANYIPTFKINSNTHNMSSAEGIRLAVSDFNKRRAEIGIHLLRGYDSSVNFSYGLFIGMAFLQTETHWVKIGLDVSRFVMDDYKLEIDKIGGIIEDDLPALERLSHRGQSRIPAAI
ncbi:MAG TPA: hypothetical protein VK112_09885 [Fodinibius sp.]|nr:hypothetical protein [Fodinibius sp.]